MPGPATGPVTGPAIGSATPGKGGRARPTGRKRSPTFAAAAGSRPACAGGRRTTTGPARGAPRRHPRERDPRHGPRPGRCCGGRRPPRTGCVRGRPPWSVNRDLTPPNASPDASPGVGVRRRDRQGVCRCVRGRLPGGAKGERSAGDAPSPLRLSGLLSLRFDA